MADAEEDSDKQYDPSLKKLEEARKKGEIAKSGDLHTAGSYAGLLLVMVSVGPVALIGMAGALAILLEQADELAALMLAGAAPLNAGLLQAVFWGTLVFFAGPALFALASVALQRAFLFTPSRIAPKWDRISPLSGAKNKFGAQGIFEFAKSAAKLVIYTTALGVFLFLQIDVIVGSLALDPRQVVILLGRLLVILLALVLLIALSIGGLDYLWQRAHHLRKNRMSRKELMDELKQSEGDPLMKQQRRQRGQEIAMNRMLADVPKADVVIVNPTHFAVALQWDRARPAPVCLAKGVDETAAKIRALAAEYAVPVHADPPTARALYAEVEVGAEIRPEHYKAVAAAIRFAETLRKKAGRAWTT